MHIKNNTQQKTNIKKSSGMKQWEFQDKNIKQFAIICSTCVKQDKEVNKITSNICNMQHVKYVQILEAMSPKQIHFIWWCTLLLGPLNGTCFISPFWCIEFLVGPNFWKICGLPREGTFYNTYF